LAHFDATVDKVDHRRSLRTEFDPASDKRYGRCYRRYREWCALVGYQGDPEWVTAEKLREFTVYMTVKGSPHSGKRYAKTTVWITLRAVELYAERAGLSISTEPALAVLDSYREELGDPPKRARRRRRAARS
jgi:hypothetical protein